MLVQVMYTRRAPPGFQRLTRFANVNGFGALSIHGTEHRALTQFANAQSFNALVIQTPGAATISAPFANAHSFAALKLQGNRALTEFVTTTETFGALDVEVSVGDPWTPASMTAPPVASNWTQFSNVTQTFEDFTSGVNGVRLRAALSGSNTNKIAGAHVAIPGGTTWDVIARVKNGGALYRGQFMCWGILMYDSVGGKMFVFGPGYEEGEVGRLKMTNGTTYSGQDHFVDGGSSTHLILGEDYWLKIHVDASNYTYFYSFDGRYWHQCKAATSKTDFLGNAANRVGIGFNYNNVSSTLEGVLECASFFTG
jgi:hypothetical protein